MSFRILTVGSLAVALALLFASSAAAKDHCAIERGGNIFVVTANDTVVQVTSSGSDSEPDLSSDEMVAFIRTISDTANE